MFRCRWRFLWLIEAFGILEEIAVVEVFASITVVAIISTMRHDQLQHLGRLYDARMRGATPEENKKYIEHATAIRVFPRSTSSVRIPTTSQPHLARVVTFNGRLQFRLKGLVKPVFKSRRFSVLKRAALFGRFEACAEADRMRDHDNRSPRECLKLANCWRFDTSFKHCLVVFICRSPRLLNTFARGMCPTQLPTG